MPALSMPLLAPSRLAIPWFTNNPMRLSSGFKQKVPIYFEAGKYIVKTIENDKELRQVRRLRYEVFHKEFAKKIIPFGSDRDRYDKFADMLVIIEKRSHQMVGTYRLISSTYSDQFYSASEFDINNLIEKQGPFIELSRACIHKNHRRGIVLHLLWKGVLRYLKATEARYLFGCSSVKTINPDEIMGVCHQLDAGGHFLEDFRLKAKKTYALDGFLNLFRKGKTIDETKSPTIEVPALLKSYLKAGAKICSEPAIDRAFRCTDFITLLDWKKVSKHYERSLSR